MPFLDLTSSHRANNFARRGSHLTQRQMHEPDMSGALHLQGDVSNQDTLLIASYPSLSSLLPSPVFYGFSTASPLSATTEKPHSDQASYLQGRKPQTTPTIGAVPAFTDADDPESPSKNTVMITGRYAYSDQSEAVLSRFRHKITFCFAPMSQGGIQRRRQNLVWPLPRNGQTTQKQRFRVNANTPNHRIGDHLRSTSAHPATRMHSRRRLLDRLGIGNQGGNHDRRAIPSRTRRRAD